MPRHSTRATLARLETRPRRSMGQNFLQDGALARWMAESLPIAPDETVVEIGPGTGAVTAHLVGRGKRLFLIEKDAKLAAHQRETFAGDDRVEVIEADAAGLDLRLFFKFGPLKVLGNLPYSVGTSIMMQWLENPSPVGHAIFMLQKEVCERVVAVPRSGDYGQLTVRLQARWAAEIIKHVPPTVFHPRPKVDSAILSLRPRDRRELPVFDETLFARLIRQGFSQRRKQLKNLLSQDSPSWEDLIATLGVPATTRAEELSVAQWVEIARWHDSHPLKDTAQSGDEIFDVVDDNDRVTGRAMRAEVHARGLKHRAVHVFAFCKNGDLLLQKRSHLKDTFPGLWDSSVAGHLDAGETYATCVRRELAEELGLEDLSEPPRRIAHIAACVETGWEFVELHTVHSVGRVRFPAAEIECVHPFAPAEIDAWTAMRPQDFAPGFLRCWHEFRHRAAPLL